MNVSQWTQFIAHNALLFAALAAILIMLVNHELSHLAGAANMLAPAAAVRLINRDDTVVVDLRETADYNAGHIRSALNVPEPKLKERLAELSRYRERPLLLYCSMGQTAVRASKTLKAAGFTQLYALKGGIGAWQQDNLPLARD